MIPSLEVGRALLAQSTWNIDEYRASHDIIIPPVLGRPGGDVWLESPYMLPARRKYLLSFQGYMDHKNKSSKNLFDISRSKCCNNGDCERRTEKYHFFLCISFFFL